MSIILDSAYIPLLARDQVCLHMADHFQPARAADLRNDLSVDRKDRGNKNKKAAMRKVVSNMSLNSIEMLSLFNEVIACLSVDDIELKKMCCLYLETYAKARPELAANALPALIKDTTSNSPLIRVVALRTLSTIALKKFVAETISLCERTATDLDPYVRVTTVYAISKAYFFDSEAVNKANLLPLLNRMLNDKNPRVCATAVSCLLDISSLTRGISVAIDESTAMHLIDQLPQCNEWCQVYILTVLQYFVPQNHESAVTILKYTFPRIQHANTAVVLATTRLTIYLLNFIPNVEKAIPHFVKSLQAPFALIMSKPPELQYVMLRNLIILLQSHPKLMKLDARTFFCTFNDPIYVKTSKVEVLYLLADEDSADLVISELYSCAADVDFEASRKAINALGRLALKLPIYADECVQHLLDISNSGAPYIVQEVTISLHYILRRFPNKYYKDFIPILCECRGDIFNDVDAKVTFIWILGQYPKESMHTPEIFEEILDNFGDEDLRVQLATLASCIKLFIAHPKVTRNLIPRVFEVAIQTAEDPDLRDRAFMYWRLLSSEPHKARDIVVNVSDTEIKVTDGILPEAVLQELQHSLGYLSSLYLKPPTKLFRIAKHYTLPQSPALVPRNQYSNIQAPPKVPPSRQNSAFLDRSHSMLLSRPPATRVGSLQTQSSLPRVHESPTPDASPFEDEKLLDI